MQNDDFNQVIDYWIRALEQYDFIQLRTKPSPKSWSLGQLYIHLINDTNFFIEQIKVCISNNDNRTEEASPQAKKMFHNNDFPDEIIEGSPANSTIPQPDTIEQLAIGLLNIKDEMNKAGKAIAGTQFMGKTKHPGLNYFSAREWFQFAGMHFRHHIRQKNRIDHFLKFGS